MAVRLAFRANDIPALITPKNGASMRLPVNTGVTTKHSVDNAILMHPIATPILAVTFDRDL